MRKSICSLAVLGIASAAFAGRPLNVGDAYPLDKGSFELEAGVEYVETGSDRDWQFPAALTYGLANNIEIGVGVGGVVDDRSDLLLDDDRESGFGDLVVGGKWQFLTREQALIDHALAFEVKFPTADKDRGLGSGETDYDLTWIGSLPLQDDLQVDVNVGYTWIGGDQDELHYGLAVVWAATDRIEPVAEVFAATPVEEGKTEALANVGVRFLVVENFMWDIAVGTGLTDDAPDVVATTGFTWSF